MFKPKAPMKIEVPPNVCIQYKLCYCLKTTIHIVIVHKVSHKEGKTQPNVFRLCH